VRLQNDGMVLWYGTNDAPAPTGAVSPGPDGSHATVTIAVAVQPPSVSNTVQVSYRVNGGSPAVVNAALGKQDLVLKIQYFSAQLPAFRVGDNVDYVAVARSPGRQVPAASDATTFPSSFSIAAPAEPESAAQSNSGPSAPASRSPAAASTPAAPPATGATAGKGPYKVDGYIFFENGLPATGVATRLYNRGFGNTATKLGEITTDVNGYYAIAYSLSRGTANLEVRVVDAHGKEVILSDTRHDAEANEVLNLVAPTNLRPVAPEYQRLSADVTKELGSLHLSSAKEDEDQQDLALISAATGWDARLVALAATASQLAPESGMSAEILYGLFRAGLPLDKNQLARTKIEEVEEALKSASQANIIKLDAHGMTAEKAAFQKFSTTTLRAASAHGTISSFTELLAHSGLTAAEQTAFEQVYFSHGSDPDQMWEKVEVLGISKQKIDTLRLQGKLYYLTLNNAPLVDYLQKEIGTLANLPLLAERELYLPQHWKEQLDKLAGNNEKTLAALIPSTYGANTTHERLEAYTNDLARRVRMSYSTYVIARMIETHDLPLVGKHKGPETRGPESRSPDTKGLEKEVPAFLRKCAALGFELGRTPVGAFICGNKDSLFAGMKPEEADSIIEILKRLHRLYQITPSDESLKALLESGLTSAHDLTRVPYEAFVTRYGHKFPSLHEAELVYRKAQQVKSTVAGHHSMAKSAANSPGFFATSPPSARRQASKDNLIEHYPNMETLFGSLDFCECSDCRSVLSPAAYLVDLLQFLDPHPAQWESFLADWKAKHNNAPYPFQNQSEWKSQSGQQSKKRPKSSEKNEKTPYEVLIERRPDIPHLPLTCENTNVAMPYIDIVNEILEYFVAHDALAAGAGYDTGKSTSPELLAEPHNILPLAYDKIRKAKYPITLPFDLWLETVRRFVHHFDVRLPEILEIFRPSDDLFAPATNPKRYYRAEIFAESLGLSPPEYSIFTDAATLNDWFALYGFTNANDAKSALSSAKTLAQSLSISYKELIAVVDTWFVNPDLHALVLLHKMETDLSQVRHYKGEGKPGETGCSDNGAKSLPAEKAAFESHLAATTTSLQVFNFDVKGWLDKAWQDGDFKRALLLTDTGDACDFGQTALTYVDGTPADAAVFLRLHLFVRLWKKLGWSIEELDHSLRVAIPKNYLPLTLANVGAAFQTALLYLAHFKSLDERLADGKGGRLKLLTLWANLFTTGKNSLYSQLFLRNSSLKNDRDYQQTFDDPLGNYLSNPNVLLKDHLIAIQAALNLTASDIECILVDAGSDVSTAVLSLDNISLLYRHGFLAKALRMPVPDLVALKTLSGLNPFQPLKPDHVAVLEDDYPFTQSLRFVDIARIVQESGFHVEDLNYLLRHQFDPVGKYRQDASALLGLVKSLAAGLHSIETEQALPADLTSLTDELLQQRLALVLPSDAVTTFMGMWNGTVQHDVVQPGVAPVNQIDPTAFAQVPSLTLTYDPVLQAQKLSFRGTLTNAQSAQLQTVNTSPVFAALLAAVKVQQQSFYDKNLSNFLSTKDYQDLFAPPPAGITDDQKQNNLINNRACLAKNLFPYVQRQLSRQFVVQTLTTTENADPSLVQALLSNPSLLNDPTTATTPLLDSFLTLGAPGVDARFFASSDGSGAPLNSIPQTLTVADTTNQKPTGTNSVQYQGYFEVPTTGPYRFYAHLGKQAAQAQLNLDPLPTPLIQGAAANDGAELSQAIDLKTGVPYFFTFTAGNLGGGDASLFIQGETLPKNPLSQVTLYSKSAVDRVDRARLLLSKTFRFITTVPLDERELRYLLTHAADFDNLSFSQLPTSAANVSPASTSLLFEQFIRLAGYARLKADIASGADDLIGIFENAQRTYPTSMDPTQAQTQMLNDFCQRVAGLTRREPSTVQAMAVQLGMAPPRSVVSGNLLTVQMPDFRQEKGLRKLWRALNVTQKLGVSVESLARWAAPSPDSAIARDLRHAVKARYEREDWLAVAPSIFDKLRQRQRDALVAYIMERNGFEDRNQLFEYFLIDPGMEPIVQTSRLRLAISAVQTFVQRCLLNLEPDVQPLAIPADQWEWMKYYRVQEASKEIFLFPENWLEPEFRDDKTDLFQELEGKLLQGDISNDLAEDALFTYLKKLEEIARLEIVGIYSEQDPVETESNILHVIGRTHSQPHKYSYRTYEHQMWTPWEAVGADIDGDHVVVVIWKSRLSLFWLTFMDKPKQDGDGGGQQIDATKPINLPTSLPHKDINVQLNWSEYYQGQWTTRGASGFGNPITVTVDQNFDRKQVFAHGAVANEGEMEVAYINLHFDLAYPSGTKFPPPVTVPAHLSSGSVVSAAIATYERAHAPKPGPLDFAFRIVSKNAPPQVGAGHPPMIPPFPRLQPAINYYVAPNEFQVTYVESIKTVDGQPPVVTVATQSILTNSGDRDDCNSLTLCPTPAHSDLPNLGVLVTPFFYQDDHHVFYVEPTLTESVIDKWDHWAVPFPKVATRRASPQKPRIVSSFPRYKPPRTLPAGVRAFNGSFGPGERFHTQIPSDPTTDAKTEVHFGGHTVGGSGGKGAVKAPGAAVHAAPKPAAKGARR
jgi:hypothetical protein